MGSHERIRKIWDGEPPVRYFLEEVQLWVEEVGLSAEKVAVD